MSLISPLDLERIFVVDVAGTPEIFSFFAMLLVAFALSRFNFPNKINLVLFALFTVIMATYMAGFYVLVILIGGIVTFYSLSKIAK
jgi:ABC-type maltose transport system permease subunit